ncbi:MAG: hypothetical protein HY960_09465 [Ignavibacteriae bacterium]|nr:hypothetical protein [Ignavibacteriota bacterium]
MTTVVFVFVCCLLVIQAGCDHGLSPEPVPLYGISGTIYFSHWIPEDSVLQLRVVLFKSEPTNILLDVLQGKAIFTDSLKPYGAASIPYSLTVLPLPAGRYSYLAVALQYGANIFSDWSVVGVYTTPADSGHASSFFVPANEMLQSININVDFQNLPPQPLIVP